MHIAVIALVDHDCQLGILYLFISHFYDFYFVLLISHNVDRRPDGMYPWYISSYYPGPRFYWLIIENAWSVSCIHDKVPHQIIGEHDVWSGSFNAFFILAKLLYCFDVLATSFLQGQLKSFYFRVQIHLNKRYSTL